MSSYELNCRYVCIYIKKKDNKEKKKKSMQKSLDFLYSCANVYEIF